MLPDKINPPTQLKNQCPNKMAPKTSRKGGKKGKTK